MFEILNVIGGINNNGNCESPKMDPMLKFKC
jgi:hypothetical protein